VDLEKNGKDQLTG